MSFDTLEGRETRMCRLIQDQSTQRRAWSTCLGAQLPCKCTTGTVPTRCNRVRADVHSPAQPWIANWNVMLVTEGLD